jgi:hypothetical protein
MMLPDPHPTQLTPITRVTLEDEQQQAAGSSELDRARIQASLLPRKPHRRVADDLARALAGRIAGDQLVRHVLNVHDIPNLNVPFQGRFLRTGSGPTPSVYGLNQFKAQADPGIPAQEPAGRLQHIACLDAAPGS